MGFRIADLKALTATLASDLAARGVAEATLAKIRPGGEENPERDAWAWVRYHGRLSALRERIDRSAPEQTTDEAAAADRVILEALAGTSTTVMLSAAESSVRELHVYPKSAFALLQCHTRNLAIARLLAYAEQMGPSEQPTAHDLVARALDEAVHQHRVLAWIACTPGPGLPFPETERDPELPESFANLAPQDCIAICRGFDEVNWARLRGLEALITPDPEAEDAPSRRPSWSKFFGSLPELEGGASERILRDRTLVGLVATKHLAAGAQREAMADAKEKSRTARGEDD